jgi:hypothetical protein
MWRKQYCCGPVFVRAEEGIKGILEYAGAVDVALGVGVKDLLLFFVLCPHHPPATPLKVVVACRFENLTFPVLVLYIHLYYKL